MADIKELKVLLSSEFDMKDLEAAYKILKMEIYRKQRKLFCHGKATFKKVLERFIMSVMKLVKSSLAAHFRLSADLVSQ